MSKIAVASRMTFNATFTLLAMFLLVGAFFSGMQELSTMQGERLSRSEDALLATADMALSEESHNVIADAVINHDIEFNVRNFDEIKSKTEVQFKQLQETAKTDEQKRLIGEAMRAHESMVKLFEKYTLPLLSQPKPDQVAITAVNKELNTQGAIIKKSLTRYSESKSQEAIVAGKNINAAQGDMFERIFIIAAAIAFLFLTNSWWTTRSIRKQLGGDPEYVAEIVNKIAAGDMAIDIHIENGDTTSMLAKIKEMAYGLSKTITGIQWATNSLAAATGQLGTMAKMLSDSSNKQVAEVAGTATPIELMTISISQNRENAKRTDDIGVIAANETIYEMHAVENAAVAIRNIAVKLEIVNQIAKQAKLLVLDAAVEAAREGKHGARFAFVTEKIRKLIEQSQLIINEISDLTRNSANMTQEVGKIIEEMSPHLLMASDFAQEIFYSSVEQSRGIAQIDRAIGHLKQSTQQNASASEQIEMIAEEINCLAEQLKSVMTFYKPGNAAAQGRVKAKQDKTSNATLRKPSGKPVVVALQELNFGRF